MSPEDCVTALIVTLILLLGCVLITDSGSPPEE